MSRDWLSFLDDMVRSLDHAAEFCSGMAEDEFSRDRRTMYAVQWALEIAGEAAKHVPPEVPARHPEVDWRRVAGFRDVLAHAHFRVGPALVWDTAVNKAPPLRARLAEVLRIETEREASGS